MRLDSTHVAVVALRDLIIYANVAGGSFAASLPPPKSIPSTERYGIFHAKKTAAVQQCISDLLDAAGLPQGLTIVNNDTGERIWPAQFVGSLSHKGTVVLGAIASSSIYSALGIDLERIDGKQDLIQEVVAPEGILPGVDPHTATVLSFSAKEAVFKAQFPRTRRRIDFSEVPLNWTSLGNSRFCASALTRSSGDFQVASKIIDPWIVCAAFSVI